MIRLSTIHYLSRDLLIMNRNSPSKQILDSVQKSSLLYSCNRSCVNKARRETGPYPFVLTQRRAYIDTSHPAHDNHCIVTSAHYHEQQSAPIANICCRVIAVDIEIWPLLLHALRQSLHLHNSCFLDVLCVLCTRSR